MILADHHGAALIVTVGCAASLDEFFDSDKRASTPSIFMTRLKVGPKLVDAKAMATLYRTRVSGVAVALLVLAALIAVIAALVVTNGVQASLDWAVDTWNSFALWVRGLIP